MTVAKGIEGYLRPEITKVGEYAFQANPKPSASDTIRLVYNENPYSCSHRVQEALAEFPSLNLYADPTQFELRELLGEYTGVSADHIVASHGSEELIDYVMRLFVGPEDEVIDSIPSFSNFRVRTQLLGGTFVEVLRNKNFSINVAALKAAITEKTKMLVLANPNNPTGTMATQKEILELVDTGLPIMIDEAYAEFAEETLTGLVPDHDNLLVLRTFSKWASAAGIRFGYGIFPPQIATYLHKIRNPANMGQIGLILVRESLKDIDYLMGNVKAIIIERERLFGELRNLKFLEPIPSKGNFIFCQVRNGDAKEIAKCLAEEGILVASYVIPWGGTALRITVGLPEHTDALIKALRQISEQNLPKAHVAAPPQ